jgi:hypothetical protein
MVCRPPKVVKNERSISTHADENGLDKSRDGVENRDRRFEESQKFQGFFIQCSHLSEEFNRYGRTEKKITYEFLVLILLKHLLLIGDPTRNPLLEHREKLDYFRFVGLGDNAADRTKNGECASFLFH